MTNQSIWYLKVDVMTLLMTVHDRKRSIRPYKFITVRVQTWQAMRLCQIVSTP